MGAHPEPILVVPAGVVKLLGVPQGFSRDLHPLEMLFREAEFRPRDDVEKDPRWKQIIPYVMYYHRGHVFTYRRGKPGAEDRLHNFRSLGVGGHVEQAKFTGRITVVAYEAEMRREQAEEVTDAGSLVPHLMGLINDDSNEVGQVHLGVLHLAICSDTSLTSREDALADPEWWRAEDVTRRREEFETWSQIVIDQFLISFPGLGGPRS